MMPTARPVVDLKSLAYLREENEGYIALVSPMDPHQNLELLNPQGVEVAGLCDGEHTVEQMEAAYLEAHPEISAKVAADHVRRALLLFEAYGILTPEPEDDEPPSGQEVRALDEGDFRRVRALLTGCRAADGGAPPRTFYQNPSLPQAVYEDMLLRNRLFNFKESMYGVLRDGELVFVLGLMDNRPVKPTATVALVVGEHGWELQDGLELLLPMARRALAPTHSKLTWPLVFNHFAPHRNLSTTAEALGWRMAAQLRDEYGPNRDELLYELHLAAGDGQAAEEQPRRPEYNPYPPNIADGGASAVSGQPREEPGSPPLPAAALEEEGDDVAPARPPHPEPLRDLEPVELGDLERDLERLEGETDE